MSRRRPYGTYRERGQATPLYMAAVVGLLFVALVYLALGQADIKRSGTQTAADAAALAAAQESRDELDLADFLDDLEDLFDGELSGTADGCAEAARFAARNDATASCIRLTDGRWGFTVTATSREPMGDNIVSGTAGERAKATATAIVEPRCTFTPAEPEAPPEDAEDSPEGEDDGQTEDGAEAEEQPSPGTLACDGEEWIVDPQHLDLLPDMADLFTVRLAED
ncbi:pilus assembly protein TadG-related protein [Streptomyces sp. HNM0663]|uniref:Pilus assembly protein TadG-related protein n=1 Tax=Streptomyces chengmaiensis TaxID=3040919 RepID=A0ABT6HXV3_9ACTN|nr:pilus assembly protein TadG-related protein [Streptomyces chengmaiensis]MDH2393548.1 pilus assembly protein TadG-related protein [Streptomyces chengmaiensis]